MSIHAFILLHFLRWQEHNPPLCICCLLSFGVEYQQKVHGTCIHSLSSTIKGACFSFVNTDSIFLTWFNTPRSSTDARSRIISLSSNCLPKKSVAYFKAHTSMNKRLVHKQDYRRAVIRSRVTMFSLTWPD